MFLCLQSTPGHVRAAPNDRKAGTMVWVTLDDPSFLATCCFFSLAEGAIKSLAMSAGLQGSTPGSASSHTPGRWPAIGTKVHSPHHSHFTVPQQDSNHGHCSKAFFGGPRLHLVTKPSSCSSALHTSCLPSKLNKKQG